MSVHVEIGRIVIEGGVWDRTGVELRVQLSAAIELALIGVGASPSALAEAVTLSITNFFESGEGTP